MNKLILCEGKTDAIFLSYYLEQVYGWTHEFPKRDIPKGFRLEADAVKGESVEWYCKGDNYLLICGVGGKDNFNSFIGGKIIPAVTDSGLFSQIAVVTDRDDREEKSICDSFKSAFSMIASDIQNNKWIKNTYTNSFNQESVIEILLLIIPADKEGALETIMMDAIAEHEYDTAIVSKAKAYINDVEPLAAKYIGKKRLKLKACLGVIWATQCPEKLFSYIDEQIRSVKWEDSEILSECFRELAKI